MNILYFLADRVFRFRYRNPNTGPVTWDVGIYEEEQDKMRRDFFIMGVVIGVAASLILGGLAWILI